MNFAIFSTTLLCEKTMFSLPGNRIVLLLAELFFSDRKLQNYGGGGGGGGEGVAVNAM